MGCVPKKVMSNAASIAESLHDASDYGFDVTVHGFSWPKIKAARDSYVARLNTIYESNLKKDHVEYIRGRASFVGPNQVQLDTGEILSATHVLIATGTPSRVAPDRTRARGLTGRETRRVRARDGDRRRPSAHARHPGCGALHQQRRLL